MGTTRKKNVSNSKPDKDKVDENANNNCNSGDFSDLSEPLYLPSMVSHWNYQVEQIYQRPGSITSMITHCALLPPPGSSFLSMAEVLEALENRENPMTSVLEALDKALERWSQSLKWNC